MSRYHICYLRPPLWPFNTSDDLLIPLSSSFMALFRFSSCLSNRCYPYGFIISTTVFSKFLSLVLISSFPIFSFGCNWDFLAEDSKSVSRLALLSKHYIISEKSKTQFNPLPFSTFPHENLASSLHFPIAVISFCYRRTTSELHLQFPTSHIPSLSVKFNCSSFTPFFIFFCFIALFFIISLKSCIDLVNLLMNYFFQGHWLSSWKNGPSSIWSISILFFKTLFLKLTASQYSY